MVNFLKIYHKKTLVRGFTLIELLVVIAIIGVLSSVVLGSLNVARAKGQEANIKSNLKNMIPQAELAYDTPGNYSLVCTDSSINKMIASIATAGGTAKCYPSQDNKRWAASAKLNSDRTKNFTVDSTGVAAWNGGDLGNMNWTAAKAACSSLGGRLPTMEQLISLYQSYGATPPNFSNYYYWASTVHFSDNDYADDVYMGSGTEGGTEDNSLMTNTVLHVRCIF